MVSKTKGVKDSQMKDFEVKAGDISSFEFQCPQTGNYSYSFLARGKYKCALVISQVITVK